MSRFPNNFLIAIIIILHGVGAIGTVIPGTSGLFVSLTPFNLLISCGLIVYSHQGPRSKLTWFALFAFTIGFGVEVIGVSTGFPFGSYSYGNTLGWKILDVPLLIGTNWFLLAYAFGCMSNQTNLPLIGRTMLSAAAMTAMDFLIEPVAISLDYWSWSSGEIPPQNYISWFVVSLIIQAIFQKLLPRERNILAIPLILSQILYFAFVYIFFNF